MDVWSNFFEEQLLSQNKKLVHHSFLIQENKEFDKKYLLNWLSEKSFLSKDKTNLILVETDKFLLEHSRKICQEIKFKLKDNEYKFFVISFSRINREAENSLLKTFEEPVKGVCFFLIVPNIDFLLPTTVSRFQIIRVNNENLKINSLLKNKKYSNELKDDFKKAEKIVKDLKEGRSTLKEVDCFLSQIVDEIRQHTDNSQYRIMIRKIINLRKKLYGSSPSIKMILETAIMIKNFICSAGVK